MSWCWRFPHTHTYKPLSVEGRTLICWESCTLFTGCDLRITQRGRGKVIQTKKEWPVGRGICCLLLGLGVAGLVLAQLSSLCLSHSCKAGMWEKEKKRKSSRATSTTSLPCHTSNRFSGRCIFKQLLWCSFSKTCPRLCCSDASLDPFQLWISRWDETGSAGGLGLGP